ncbi:MAG: nitroreductase family protein, partial [Spirochaetales bacterium]|nr:nitroreductase family protein [Spirochaetales bacterium]
MLEYRRDPRALIRERSSVRSFRAQPLPAARRAALEAACGQLQLGPLGTPCRFRLLDREAWNPKAPGGPRGERLGTYGVIRGAPTYLAGAAVRGELALVDFGYLFELLVLKATDLGLGTCWLGGTLRRAGFGRALELREDELLPAVSPVGIPAERRSVIDRLFRLGARSSLRRRWETLFLDESGR